jgi:hypothetical protein
MKVTTHQLSADGATVEASTGVIERGEISATELQALLTRFAAIDAIENQYGDPHVIVRVRDEAHLIRTNRGRLHLYNARDVSQPAIQLGVPSLMALLEGNPEAAVSPVTPELPELDIIPPQRKHNVVLAVTILVAGLGLNVWGLAQHLRRDRDRPPPEYVTITEPARLASLQRKVPGVYATGSDAGSRLMTIRPEGIIEFALLARDSTGSLHPIRRFSDKFVWGQRRDGTVCLVTATRGQVELGADNESRHYGDRYLLLAGGK